MVRSFWRRGSLVGMVTATMLAAGACESRHMNGPERRGHSSGWGGGPASGDPAVTATKTLPPGLPPMNTAPALQLMNTPGKSVSAPSDGKSQLRADGIKQGVKTQLPGAGGGASDDEGMPPPGSGPRFGLGFSPRRGGPGAGPHGMAVYLVIPLVPDDPLADAPSLPGESAPGGGGDDPLGSTPGQGGGPRSPDDVLAPPRGDESSGGGGEIRVVPRLGEPFAHRSITN